MKFAFACIEERVTPENFASFHRFVLVLYLIYSSSSGTRIFFNPNSETQTSIAFCIFVNILAKEAINFKNVSVFILFIFVHQLFDQECFLFTSTFNSRFLNFSACSNAIEPFDFKQNVSRKWWVHIFTFFQDLVNCRGFYVFAKKICFYQITWKKKWCILFIFIASSRIMKVFCLVFMCFRKFFDLFLSAAWANALEMCLNI